MLALPVILDLWRLRLRTSQSKVSMGHIVAEANLYNLHESKVKTKPEKEPHWLWNRPS